MNALVTDGDQRPALAITRSLGRRGLAVVVGEARPASLASSSRYCAGHVTYPSPYREPAAFERFVADLVERERIDVVIPVSDVTTASVCRIQEALRPRAATALPRFGAFDFASDKSACLQAAARCGIPIPRTHFVEGMAALPRLVGRIEYPAVIKAARSRIPTARGFVSTGVHYAGCEADLRRLYERTGYLAAHPSLIQQRVVGPGLGLFVLFDRGELVTAFAHRRLREKPPSGGVSVLCESVPVAPELQDDAVRLLGPLGWHGVAMLEYKRDGRTGQRFLLEVNARFWGSLQLAVDAGVDFPDLVHRLARGLPLPAPADYRIGVKNRWLLGHLDHVLARVFKRDRDLCLPERTPSRLGTLLEFLACARPGQRDQVLDRHDPGPFRYELRRYASVLSESIAGRARGLARARPRGLPLARPDAGAH